MTSLQLSLAIYFSALGVLGEISCACAEISAREWVSAAINNP
jgi:hypothetical protein